LHVWPRQVRIGRQVQPGRSLLHPTQDQLLHRIEADRPQPDGIQDCGSDQFIEMAVLNETGAPKTRVLPLPPAPGPLLPPQAASRLASASGSSTQRRRSPRGMRPWVAWVARARMAGAGTTGDDEDEDVPG